MMLQTLRLPLLLLVTLLIGLAGCSNKDELVEDNRTAEDLYLEAKSRLENDNWQGAVRAYRALQTRYPFGRYAEQAQLEMAYAYYRASQPEQALATADRFIRTYPAHPNLDYAYYIRGLTNYDLRVGFLEQLFPSRVRDRDQSSALEAFRDFDELIRRFPDSRYAPDARQRMVFLRNNLSYYEIDVANYYMRRKAYVAAVNRAKYLLETYPGSPEASEALLVLHEAYTELDMTELADDAIRVLEYNEPDHPYFTGDYGKKSIWDRLWPWGDDD